MVAHEQRGTLVRLREHGFALTVDDRKSLQGNSIGWGVVSTLMKFYVEHGLSYQPQEELQMAPLHELRFPGESEQYRNQRDDLLKAEIELRQHEEAVAAQRRKLPLGGEVPSDYTFDEWDADKKVARPVRLSELFEDGKDTLFLYSHMFIPGKQGLPLEEGCPSCTSIIDAIDGSARHITQQINFAVVAKAPIQQFRGHAQARGWRHARLLSSAGNTYNREYHAESPDGEQLPVATVFSRGGGKIHHTWSSELFFVPADPGQDMRHVDFMWPMWKILDTTPKGRGKDWGPELDYSAGK